MAARAIYAVGPAVVDGAACGLCMGNVHESQRACDSTMGWALARAQKGKEELAPVCTRLLRIRCYDRAGAAGWGLVAVGLLSSCPLKPRPPPTSCATAGTCCLCPNAKARRARKPYMHGSCR